MKRFYLFIAIVLSCLSCKDKRGHINGLYIEDSDWDFGTVKPNDKVEHVFVIENLAKDTCFIKSVVASCGCTNYTLEKDTLLPNDVCRLSVVLNTPSTTGYIMRDLTIYASISEKPIVVTLSAYIPMSKELVKRLYRKKMYENVYTKTDIVYLGNLYMNEQLTNQIELVNTSGKTISINYCITSNIDYVTLEGPKELYPWKPEQITINCDGEKIKDEWGEKTFYFKLREDSIKCVVNLIPMCKTRIDRHGARVFVSNVTTTDISDDGQIEIRNMGSENLRILKVQTSQHKDVSIIDSVISPRESGFVKIMNSGYEDTIEILSNDKLNPIVKIPLVN